MASCQIDSLSSRTPSVYFSSSWELKTRKKSMEGQESYSIPLTLNIRKIKPNRMKDVPLLENKLIFIVAI